MLEKHTVDGLLDQENNFPLDYVCRIINQPAFLGCIFAIIIIALENLIWKGKEEKEKSVIKPFAA
jgi:hypothetical protein